MPSIKTTARRIDLPDPALHSDDLDASGKPLYKKVRFTGPLGGPDGVEMRDIVQGALADCYWFGAGGALLATNKDFLDKHVRKGKRPGEFECLVYERNSKRELVAVWEPVDADLYVDENGEALYGEGNATPDTPDKMRLLVPLLEKAYAQRKGSYDTIADDTPVNALEALSGRTASHLSISRLGDNTVWGLIKRAVDEKRAMTAGTPGDGDEAEYEREAGLLTSHTYSVLGYRLEKDEATGKEERLVKLRNPWGKRLRDSSTEDNGEFEITIEKFNKYVVNLCVIDPDRPAHPRKPVR